MSTRVEPKWWGIDKTAAVKHARKHGLYVIYSKGPERMTMQPPADELGYGYWTDSEGLCRNWERIEHSPPIDD